MLHACCIALVVVVACAVHALCFYILQSQHTTPTHNSLNINTLPLPLAPKQPRRLRYSKGLLSEILDFVMGSGLIPADGEVWKVRRRAVVPALHKRYVASMVGMFGDCAAHGAARLEAAAAEGKAVEMENWFSRLALDIIGKVMEGDWVGC